MRRSALRNLLQQLLLASLPLAAACAADDADSLDFEDRCAGFDAGSGTAIMTVPIVTDADAGPQDCRTVCAPGRQNARLAA